MKIFNWRLGLMAVAILNTLTCSTCNRLDPVITYYMSKDFKQFIMFPVGSYWIYDEVYNGSQDSIYLFKSFYEITKASEKLGYDYERYQPHFSSTYLNDTLIGDTHPDRDRVNFYYYSQGSQKNIPNFPVLFFDSAAVNFEYNYAENYILKYENTYSSYVVQNTEYSDVRVYVHQTQFFPEQEKRIYYAKSVGIIRKEMFNGEIWELKKFVKGN